MNKNIGLIMAIVFMFTSIGCWDVRDISNRAFVTCMGLDFAPNGYKVTVIMPRPANIRNRSAQVFFVTEIVEAETISKAVSVLQSKLSRDLSFGHLRVLVVGEKLARQSNFNDLISFLGKNPETALRFRLMFVNGGEAAEVLKTLPLVDRSKSAELVGLTEAGEDLGVARTKRFYSFLGDLRQTDGNAMGSRVTIHNTEGQQIVSQIGGAIFTNWRLAGWLNSDEMQAANWILRQNPNIVVVSKIGKGKFSCLIDTKDVKISPNIYGARPKFKVDIKVVGNIIEQQGSSLDLTDPRNLGRIETVLTENIYQQASRALNKSQKDMEIDYLGFDRALIKNDPELYKKLDWRKVYPNVPIELKVNVRVPRVGIERR